MFGEKFVFIHIPKCAGYFIKDFILKNKLGRDLQGEYSTAFLIPEPYHNKEIIASIRNPWDWYVSLWGYRSQRRERDEIQIDKPSKTNDPHSEVSYFNPDVPFRQYIFNMLDDGANKSRMGREILLGSDPIPKNKLCYVFRDMVVQDIGFYSYYINFMGGDIINKYLKVENIEEELKSYFGIPVTDKNRINCSRREKDYRPYYDETTMEMVRHKDRLMIDKFGYSF